MPQTWEGYAAVSEQQWIIIPKWGSFQHYKDRTPKWIKVYTELLHDENYLALTGDQRAILCGLWLEYASSRSQLPLNTRSLSSRLRLRVTTRQLDILNRAGFLEYALAPRYQDASLDLDRDRDKNLSLLLTSQTDPVKAEAAIEKMIINGVITNEVDLTAELNGYDLNGASAERLRALLSDGATPSTADDDIPF